MPVLVLGSSGQLASHLKALLPDAQFWGRDTFDLRQPGGLSLAIERAEPNFIINSAAYTAVDKAEADPDAAWCLNAEAPANAARAAAALDIPLVHVSTDYVFDGNKRGDYAVGDACNPLSVYGSTKLAGELAVRLLAPKSWILRTSWVFSEHGSNFMKTVIRLAKERPELRVVADQFGRPTYAGDLARLVANIASSPSLSLPFGTYHAVGGASTSWHGFAEAIVQAALRAGVLSREPFVRAISTSEYPTAARRPSNSSLEPSAELYAATQVRLDWAEGLDAAVQRGFPDGVACGLS
jgi:dTDP-4-dehydrorhamnose reductase